MPGRDGSGPAGEGAMTGRGAGFCAGNAGFGYGRYFRRGRRGENGFPGVPGRNRGFFRRSFPVQNFEVNREMLLEDEKILQQELENTRKRLAEFKESDSGE